MENEHIAFDYLSEIEKLQLKWCLPDLRENEEAKDEADKEESNPNSY